MQFRDGREGKYSKLRLIWEGRYFHSVFCYKTVKAAERSLFVGRDLELYDKLMQVFFVYFCSTWDVWKCSSQEACKFAKKRSNNFA